MYSKNDFINMMLRFPDAELAQSDRWIIMNCRYCTSRSNNSKHMGIKIPENGEVPYFNCVKCHTSGTVNISTLLKWGIEDQDGLVDFGKYYKENINSPKNKRFRTNSFYLRNNFINQSKLSEVKLKYINNRLGTNLTYSDLLDKKIVLNIDDLLYTNKISHVSRDVNIVKQLNSSFLGFISKDNAFINMRRLVADDKVCKSLRKRYVNYSIFDKFDNTLRYYIIPTKINICDRNRINIYIAEGPFDILSIYYNVIEDKYNTVFASILGSNYFQIILYFLVDLKIQYVNFHIFIDSDVDMRVFRNISLYLKKYNIPLYIHKNLYKGEKDYGVRKEKIKDYIIKI